MCEEAEDQERNLIQEAGFKMSGFSDRTVERKEERKHFAVSLGKWTNRLSCQSSFYYIEAQTG